MFVEPCLDCLQANWSTFCFIVSAFKGHHADIIFCRCIVLTAKVIKWKRWPRQMCDIVKSYVAICFVDMYLYLYLSTFKSTCILLKYFSKNNATYLYLYFHKYESTCTLLKYFHMYFAPCLVKERKDWLCFWHVLQYQKQYKMNLTVNSHTYTHPLTH